MEPPLGRPNRGSSSEGKFPKTHRVRRQAEFRAAQKRGTRLHTDWFVVLVAHDASRAVSPPRLGITASRKTGNSVLRNRTKRLIRDWFRRTSRDLPAGVDLVVVCRQDLPWLTQKQVDAALNRLGRRIKI